MGHVKANSVKIASECECGIGQILECVKLGKRGAEMTWTE